ncbi:hypothetical protein [Dyadobacter bucti]|uniref:hypothetical protein n=1 Tax=Dyadobacter bucti TaxID=2572203 RepID=UPI003F711A61
MNPTTKIRKNKWPPLLLSLGLGVLLFFVMYMIYIDAARDDEIAANHPQVYMKVIGRERGAGTLKFPDHIYAEHQGKKYDFTCGRKFFRKTMAADSIAAHLDVARGEAALPGSGRVRHLAFLLVWITGIGILVICIGVRKFIKSS